MKYSRIAIVDLKTIDQCQEAIQSIESDYLNCEGGISAWNSGRTTYLLTGATKKIEAIKRKDDRLYLAMIKAEYKRYVKGTSEPVSFEVYEENEMYC